MNFVIRNAALYDGTGAEAQPGMDVLVKNGKIARVGTALAADGSP
jgi:N-acyl-D-aspartate/D-glutamate deacylase